MFCRRIHRRLFLSCSKGKRASQARNSHGKLSRLFACANSGMEIEFLFSLEITFAFLLSALLTPRHMRLRSWMLMWKCRKRLTSAFFTQTESYNPENSLCPMIATDKISKVSMEIRWRKSRNWLALASLVTRRNTHWKRCVGMPTKQQSGCLCTLTKFLPSRVPKRRSNSSKVRSIRRFVTDPDTIDFELSSLTWAHRLILDIM